MNVFKIMLSFVLIIMVNAIVIGQAPKKISYQAVIRNSENKLVNNKKVGMQVSILQVSSDGSSVYTETHTPTTNANGLISIEIGGGTKVSGDFATIKWGDSKHFIKTEIDPKGGTDYSIEGTTQLLSVPYALHAETAKSLIGGSAANEQNLSEVLTKGNSAANKTIADLANPVEMQDAATKAYVDEVKKLVLQLHADKGVVDIEGNKYKTVAIGSQIWMAENLKTTKYNDGTSILNLTSNDDWRTTVKAAYCWYNNDIAYKDKKGALYNAYAVYTKKLCPVGWHVPSEADVLELFKYLGGKDVAGGKLKQVGTTHWKSPNTGATNETGFTAIPGGIRLASDAIYYDEDEDAYFWTRTYGSNEKFSYFQLYYKNVEAFINSEGGRAREGFSVRCIKN